MLDKRTAEAQTSFEAAKKVAEKDARAEAMGAANKMLSELLQGFASYESATEAQKAVGAAKQKLEDATTMLKEAADAIASTDGYLDTEKQLNQLLTDKELMQLPAVKVNPALEAAKTAQRNAGYALTEAGGDLPLMAKAAVLKATRILSDAIAPLKALKPAPAAAAKPVAKKQAAARPAARSANPTAAETKPAASEVAPHSSRGVPLSRLPGPW